MSAFDPLDLDIDVTPARVLGCLEEEAWFDALLMALRLNEGAFFLCSFLFFFAEAWFDALLMALRLNEGAVLFLFVLIFFLLACSYPRILTRCSRCFEHRFFFSRFFFLPRILTRCSPE